MKSMLFKPRISNTLDKVALLSLKNSKQIFLYVALEFRIASSDEKIKKTLNSPSKTNDLELAINQRTENDTKIAFRRQKERVQKTQKDTKHKKKLKI